jgi:hypothetical protein
VKTGFAIAWLGLMACGGVSVVEASGAPPPVDEVVLAQRILADQELGEVLDRARTLLRGGLTAGSSYGEVWVRDLNTGFRRWWRPV